MSEPAKCSVSGSFRKNLDSINRAIDKFRSNGIQVLSPGAGEAADEEGEFIILEDDEGGPNEIEKRHMKAISESHFLYVVNPGGYVGPSTTGEMGFAYASGVPVFLLEPPEDFIHRFLSSETGLSVENAIERFPEYREDLPPSWAGLPTFQRYYEHVSKQRGFEQETTLERVLLLIEEVGELAKAVRRIRGLNIEQDSTRSQKRIPEELADSLIYLIHIANSEDIDLAESFLKKEALNKEKEWSPE